MPVSASRLRLAGWAVIIGLVVFVIVIGAEVWVALSRGEQHFDPTNVTGWQYVLQLVLPWLSLAAAWIVLTTWKRIALAAKPTAFVKWTFDLILVFTIISSIGGFLAILGLIPSGIWDAASSKAMLPIDVILGALLFFALGGISDEAMPLVYPMRWTMAFSLVAFIIITVLVIDVRIFTEAGPIVLLLYAALLIGLLAMVLFVILFCLMFFKLARRVDKAGRPQDHAPVPAQG